MMQTAESQLNALPHLTHALKEWAIAVDALCRGETIVLLRKGGIREEQGRFTVQQPQVWLYPTYEHQRPELLKLAYQAAVQPVESGWHPEEVNIPAWASITHIFEVTESDQLEALLPFHIWNEHFAAERFRWKPKQPLYVLLLRVYRLAASVTLPYQPEFGGCKSWLDLSAQPIAPALAKDSTPALSDEDYVAQAQAIAAHLSASDSAEK